MKKCRNCNNLYNDNVDRCPDCNEPLETYIAPQVEPVYTSHIFKYIPLIMAVLFIIAGVIAGSTFKIAETHLYTTKEKFNVALMFTVWVSAIIPVIASYAVYVHIRNQETQIDISNQILNILSADSTAKSERALGE